jgi:hypothetical protein
MYSLESFEYPLTNHLYYIMAATCLPNCGASATPIPLMRTAQNKRSLIFLTMGFFSWEYSPGKIISFRSHHSPELQELKSGFLIKIYLLQWYLPQVRK